MYVFIYLFVQRSIFLYSSRIHFILQSFFHAFVSIYCLVYLLHIAAGERVGQDAREIGRCPAPQRGKFEREICDDPWQNWHMAYWLYLSLQFWGQWFWVIPSWLCQDLLQNQIVSYSHILENHQMFRYEVGPQSQIHEVPLHIGLGPMNFLCFAQSLCFGEGIRILHGWS